MKTFLRLSASWSNHFQPRGSWALIWAFLSTLHELSFADGAVSHQPLIVGADQSPPGRNPGSQWSGAGLFHPKNSERLSFFSRFLTGEILAARYAGVSAATRLGMLVTPACMVWQNLPTCCCKSLGTLRSMLSKCIYEIYKSVLRA